jgi:hypothetical protein
MVSEKNQSDDPFREQPKRLDAILGVYSVVACALLVVVCAVVGSRAFFPHRPVPRPFPEVAAIERIEAEYYDSQSDKSVTFRVPKSHWNVILSALLPAEKDDAPAKWVSLGDLHLTLTNGDKFLISVYKLPEDPGAFSAGPRQQRNYYRGGSSAAVEQEFAQAWAASKKAD